MDTKARNATSTPNGVDRLYTVPAAARELGISPRVLRAARDRGELAVYKLGDRWERVTLAECRAWIRAQRVDPSDHARTRVRELLEREGRAS
jgi:hypothetical protein